MYDETFSPSVSHTVLVFLYQILQQYCDGDTLTGASNTGGYENRDKVKSLDEF